MWNDQQVHLVCLLPTSGWLCHLISGIIFYGCVCEFYVPPHSCDWMACFDHHDFVISAIMVICPIAYFVTFIHCPPSSLCTAKVDPEGRNGIILSVAMSFIVWGCICLSKKALRLLSLSLSHSITCYLIQNVAWLGSLGLIGGDVIYNKVIYASALVGYEMITQHDIYLVTCRNFNFPNMMAFLQLILLQGRPYSEKPPYTVCIRLCVLSPSTCDITKDFLW